MRLLPLYREQLLVWDRTPYALPLRGDAPVVVAGSRVRRERVDRQPGALNRLDEALVAKDRRPIGRARQQHQQAAL